MIKTRLTLCLFLCSFLSSMYANETEKYIYIEKLRKEFSRNKFRDTVLKVEAKEMLEMLDENGRFRDMYDCEEEIFQGNYLQSNNSEHCVFINEVTRDCFERLQIIAETYRGQSLNPADDIIHRILKGIVHYGKMENERSEEVAGRFHASCFATPRAAVNLYFCLFDLMEKVESGEIKDPLLTEVRNKLIDVAFQSWRLPLRHDETDENVVSVERFRKHVWWVGGNALDFRPVFHTAVMMKSIPMLDVMAEVAVNSLSYVSQTTIDDAFWTEGITADGAGWGHGKQSLVWRYPIDGVYGAFRVLHYLKNSPWGAGLTESNIEVLMNYIRGSAFYHFRGIMPPIIDRENMVKAKNRKSNIPSRRIAISLLNDWKSLLTTEQIEELEDFITESSLFDVNMTSYPDGDYTGVRYFYNNDDIIKKTADYYVFVNMASYRVDGLESAYSKAAGYNFYSADGVTLFQKTGDEYTEILGAMKLTAWPGVTTRQTPVELQPVENWRGFTSKHNFAAGASNNSNSYAAGFIYEKMNGSMRDNVEFAMRNDKNKEIYGVKAYKSYFMFDNIFLALGSGITNLEPEKEGEITTTIDQTHSPAAPEGWEEIKSLSVVQQCNENESINWIKHNGFVYGVLSAYTTGNVWAGREFRMTDWKRLCPLNKEEDETEVPVFQLEINHGKDVVDGSYGYIVACDGQIPNRLPEILSNDTTLQAAQSADGKKVGAIFYDPSKKVEASMGSFQLSHPAALFVENKEEEVLITVTDAKMQPGLNEMILTTSLPLKGGNVNKEQDLFRVKISLPTEPNRGAPTTYVFSINK